MFLIIFCIFHNCFSPRNHSNVGNYLFNSETPWLENQKRLLLLNITLKIKMMCIMSSVSQKPQATRPLYVSVNYCAHVFFAIFLFLQYFVVLFSQISKWSACTNGNVQFRGAYSYHTKPYRVPTTMMMGKTIN